MTYQEHGIVLSCAKGLAGVNNGSGKVCMGFVALELLAHLG